ncbi:MAG: hypothetical protein VZQ62_00530 [Methanosphaera sp.]|nr:hypothetical protein [Methanosphaera sp.]
MNGSGISASDVLALTKGNDGFGFGGVGGFILLFIFLMALGGNGIWGGNNVATELGQSDLQNSLYFQSQDAAIRGLAQGQCNIVDSALNNKYDNAVLIKDLSNQMSNSVASLGNQIANQTATITNLFNEQTIDRLRDQVTVLRGQNSNLIQTAEITQNILGNLATTAPKPPCYYGCGGCGCNSLY